jgi:hypothetical protein
MTMDEATAIQIASASRAAHAVPARYALRGAERRIIELCAGSQGVGALVRDVRVWIVRFQAGAAWVELAVDETTGTTVRVQRSRTP